MVENKRAHGIITADRPDVLVVGAGIVGLACALELRLRGLRVEVIEARDPGGDASLAAAGMLAPVAESNTASGAIDDLTRVGLEARNHWESFAPELAEISGLDLGYSQHGTVALALDDNDEASLDRLRDAATVAGEPVSEWSVDRLRAEVPGLSPAARRAIHLPREATIDPRQTVRALRLLLTRRGAPIHSQRTVENCAQVAQGIRLAGRGWRTVADKVVIACGAWSGEVLGAPSLVQPVRGQMISYRVPGLRLDGALRCGHLYALKRGDELLVGATAERAGFDERTTDAAREELIDFAQRVFPSLRWKAVARHWSGLRPATTDELPVIGEWGGRSLFVATGHYRSGILLAPWTARVIASLIVDGQVDGIPESFSSRRLVGA